MKGKNYDRGGGKLLRADASGGLTRVDGGRGAGCSWKVTSKLTISAPCKQHRQGLADIGAEFECWSAAMSALVADPAMGSGPHHAFAAASAKSVQVSRSTAARAHRERIIDANCTTREPAAAMLHRTSYIRVFHY